MIDYKAFYKLSYGLYIVSSAFEGKINAQIANTVFQISSEPPMIAVSINKQNLTHEYIEKSKKIGISVLAYETPMELIGKFGFKSGRDTDKFSGTSYKILESGIPIITENSVSYFELEAEKEIDVYTHTIFICRVKNSELLKDTNPMTYSHYQDIKRGRSSGAPGVQTENKSEIVTDVKNSSKYQCTVCGYIYDPNIGDPNSGIPAGTLFENLPDSWTCPICGVTKDMFEKVI
ncbi:MAG: rubredoxin [Bacillota bacterium]|nr:rubredoxin [Bacillota bacterium]